MAERPVPRGTLAADPLLEAFVELARVVIRIRRDEAAERAGRRRTMTLVGGKEGRAA